MRDSNFAGDFRLSMTEALRSQLIARLEALDWAALERPNLDTLERRGGVYQLALDGRPVYVGKSRDALPERLGNHLRKLSGRRQVAVTTQASVADRVTFRCAYVDEDLDAVAPEKMLMAALGERGEASWNTMGFGNKDPGRNRDRTLVKAGHFDRLFPVDLSVVVEIDPTARPITLADVMSGLKSRLPFTYRFGGSSALGVEVTDGDLPAGSRATAAEWFATIAGLLPAGWVHVCLPGYVVAYPGLDETQFGSRSASWRSTGGGVAYLTHDPDFAAGTAVHADED